MIINWIVTYRQANAHLGKLRHVLFVDEAARIFMEAKHPKSFISLDQTDHLISKKQDAEYIAENIACWAQRYIRLR